MDVLARLYRERLALLTDLYQLTMAYGYWKSGLARHEAAFHLSFRRCPFDGGYSIACGLATAIELLEGMRFETSDLDYLATVAGADGKPLFDGEFLAFLGELRFACDVDAIREGTVVFAHEPLVRVCGPIIQCQMLETALLNIVNFQTLAATKAARICQAVRGDRVIEFGLRRAQGIDGALSASRAAYVGGCAATSNVLAGKLYGIPVAGTHAHSWVMAFDDELEAFQAYAEAMPNNCVFLVDTYETLDGVRNAVRVGDWLRERGHKLGGIRLDSGDLAWLSVEARRILDDAGFHDAQIVASNDLDERLIASLKAQGAKITVWGVGTKLVTAYDQPALGGVYKMGAIRGRGEGWQYRLKLSEQAVKTSLPGILQVRRFHEGASLVADMIFDEPLHAGSPGPDDGYTIIDPNDATRRRRIPRETPFEDLLAPVFRRGELVYRSPPLADIRQRAAQELARLSPSVLRFDHPHEYPVGLEPRLHELKTRLIAQARGLDP